MYGSQNRNYVHQQHQLTGPVAGSRMFAMRWECREETKFLKQIIQPRWYLMKHEQTAVDSKNGILYIILVNFMLQNLGS